MQGVGSARGQPKTTEVSRLGIRSASVSPVDKDVPLRMSVSVVYCCVTNCAKQLLKPRVSVEERTSLDSNSLGFFFNVKKRFAAESRE